MNVSFEVIVIMIFRSLSNPSDVGRDANDCCVICRSIPVRWLGHKEGNGRALWVYMNVTDNNVK